MMDFISTDHPDRIALRDESKAVTYAALAQEVAKKQRHLRGFDTVALAMDNSVDWVLWDLAALKSAVTLVPLPLFFSEEQRQNALQSSGCQAVITGEGMQTLSAQKMPLPKKTAKITYTSGTTGTPKGICLSGDAQINVARSLVKALGDHIGKTHVCILPLAVLLENVAGVYAGLMAGCTVELISLTNYGASYENLHQMLKRRQANSIILVPEILRILIHQTRKNGPLIDLKYAAVGGSKIDPLMVRTARDLGLPVYEGYGLSECASVVALNTPDDDEIGSAGKILPHIKAEIIDGEIIIKNPALLGHEGGFPTGDLGRLNNEGRLYITGRKKNILITSYGRNVSPEWIEARLLCQPEIAQAIVYGDGAPQLSALIVAAFAGADLQKSVEQVNTGLPDYARIYNVTSIAPLTAANGFLTGNGRPRREKILQHYLKGDQNELLRTTC